MSNTQPAYMTTKKERLYHNVTAKQRIKGIKRYKLLCKKYDTKTYCTAQEIEPIYYNNFR